MNSDDEKNLNIFLKSIFDLGKSISSLNSKTDIKTGEIFFLSYDGKAQSFYCFSISNKTEKEIVWIIYKKNFTTIDNFISQASVQWKTTIDSIHCDNQNFIKNIKENN